MIGPLCMPVHSTEKEPGAWVPMAIFDERVARRNHGQQTLDTLRERGGLGYCEMAAIIEGVYRTTMSRDEAKRFVGKYVNRWLSGGSVGNVTEALHFMGGECEEVRFSDGRTLCFLHNPQMPSQGVCRTREEAKALGEELCRRWNAKPAPGSRVDVEG